MSKVWIKIIKRDRYSQDNDVQWKLGTIVGEQTCKRNKEQIYMAEMLSGDTYWLEKRLLVNTDDGEVHEVWQSEVFEPTEATDSPKQPKVPSEPQTDSES